MTKNPSAVIAQQVVKLSLPCANDGEDKTSSLLELIRTTLKRLLSTEPDFQSLVQGTISPAQLVQECVTTEEASDLVQTSTDEKDLLFVTLKKIEADNKQLNASSFPFKVTIIPIETSSKRETATVILTSVLEIGHRDQWEKIEMLSSSLLVECLQAEDVTNDDSSSIVDHVAIPKERDASKYGVQFLNELILSFSEVEPASVTTDRDRQKRELYETPPSTRHIHVNLPKQIVRDLHQMAKDTQSSVDDVLLSLFVLLVYRYSGCFLDEFSIALSTSASNGRSLVPLLCEIPDQDAPFNSSIVQSVTTAKRSSESVFLRYWQSQKQLQEQQQQQQQQQGKPFHHTPGIPLWNVSEFIRNHVSDHDIDDHPLQRLRLLFSAHSQQNGSDNGNGMTRLKVDEIGPVVYSSLPHEMDLAFHVNSHPGGIAICVQYRSDLYEHSTVQRLVDHYVSLATSVAGNPSKQISQFNMVTDAERHQLLYEWSQVGDNDFEGKIDTALIHDILDQQMQEAPDAVALVQQQRKVTYRQLQHQSNQIARHLRHNLGIGREQIVPVFMPKCPECIIAMVAILKAGGAFVYIDPAFPRDRVRYMVQDVKAVAVLVHPSTADIWQSIQLENEMSSTTSVLINLDHGDEKDNGWLFGDQSTANLETINDPSDLAIIQFTSGSTGHPKGVSIEHRNMCNLLLTNPNGVQQGTKMLHWAAMTYIVGIREWIQCLASGGTLIVPGEGELPVGSNLYNIIDQYEAETMTLTASALATLPLPPPASLRQISLSGESVPAALAHRILTLPDRQLELWMNFGASECSGMIARNRMSVEVPATCVGKTLQNMRVYILDKHMQPVPVGVPGYLHFGGTCVARGYLNRPDLDEGKFLGDNPFLSSAERQRHGGLFSRLYKTGDLAKWRSDGTVEYMMRSDNVVKIRGMRVELDEIKTVIMELWGTDKLQDVAVAAKRKSNSAETGLMIVAYLVPRVSEDDLPSRQELHQQLRQRLPNFMIPSAFVFMESLPLNRSAKLDMKKLPYPDFDAIVGSRASTRVYVAPGKGLEEQLVGIWGEVLDLDSSEISATDDFFDLGGNSLSITKIAARMQELHQVEVPLTALFENSTLQKMANVISSSLDASEGSSTMRQELLLVPQSRPKQLPHSFPQQRLWIVDQLLEDDDVKSVYNLNAVYRLRGNVNREALYTAFVALIERHEVLRTVFRHDEQVLLPTEKSIDFTWQLIMKRDPEERLQTARDMALKEVTRSFNLQAGPLIRAIVLELAKDGDVIFVITVHHIVFDGWSRGLMIQEIAELYNAKVEGRSPSLPSLPVQYADFSVWQRQNEQLAHAREKQLEFWKSHLKAAPTALELPLDPGKKRPAVPSYRGATFRFAIDASTADQLRSFARQERSTSFMILLSLYYIWLYKHSGQSDLVVGVAIANRRFRELEHLIGFFVNMMALRVRIEEDSETLQSLLQQVRDTTLQAYENQDVPFEQVVSALNVPRDGSRNPLFQAAFGLQTAARAGDIALNLSGGVETVPFDLKHHLSMFDITLLGNELADRSISFTLEYSKDLFSEKTIALMADRFIHLVRNAVKVQQILLSDLDIVPSNERELLQSWSGHVDHPFPSDTAVHHLIEHTAEHLPDTVALVHGQAELTYSELNNRSNQLARLLLKLKHQGPRSDDRKQLVAICIHKSIEYIVAVLAVLKMGHAFLPIDPSLPRDRILYYVEDSGCEILFVDSKTQNDVGHVNSVALINIDQALSQSGNMPVANLGKMSAPNDLAYVIYTSGSTGLPKGSQIEHRSICNLCHWLGDVFQLAPGKRVMMFASLSFDASVADFLPTLIHGATLVIPDSTTGIAMVGDELQDFLSRYQVNIVTLPPVALGTLEDKCALETVIIAGEASNENVVEKWRRLVRLINGYGPSEATIGTSYNVFPFDDSDFCVKDIGKPLKNVRYYILDRHLRPVPIGVPGELYIGGVGVGRGYIKRAQLNSEVFLKDPFALSSNDLADGEQPRMYKTGDLVRWMTNGSVEYIGRADRQVKIRGFRIELGEIENNMEDYFHESEKAFVLKRCIVVDRSSSDSSDKHLAAFLSFADFGASPDFEAAIGRAMRNLAAKLPQYMLPSVVYAMPSSKIPLNSSGKIDIKALSSIPSSEQLRAWGAVRVQLGDSARSPAQSQISSSHQPIAAPMSRTTESFNGDLEKILTEIWVDVLHAAPNDISNTTSFFEAGGNSITATSLVREMKKRLGLSKLQLVHVFQFPTISQMAEHLASTHPVSVPLQKLPKSNNTVSNKSRDIAVIGMACRVPGASSPDEFWENLCNGVESIKRTNLEELDPQLANTPGFVPTVGGVLEREVFEQFDYSFFGYSQREASLIDPQHRLLLECSWEAIEHAGIDPAKLKGSNTGVFAGAGLNHYLLNHLSPILRDKSNDGPSPAERYAILISQLSIAPRVAFKLGLNGPAVSVDTACSTSLVSIAMACSAIRNGECEMALAGGVSLADCSEERNGYVHQDGMIRSKDGYNRTFDADASGTVPGQGCGVILLKPLDDAIRDGDKVYAVVKGVAVNNDGDQKVGFTAPSVVGQSEVIERALQDGCVNARTVSYVECHGTATRLGDVIEVSALTQAYRRHTDDIGFCRIGSVKSNIGHLDAAAGVAGMIKTVLALHHGAIPPSLHFKTPNPELNLHNSPFSVATDLTPWVKVNSEQGVRRAAVSSLGIGGTNAHIVLEEAPALPRRRSVTHGKTHILLISAKSPKALQRKCEQLSEFLSRMKVARPDDGITLTDLEYALTNRSHFSECRLYVVCQTVDDAIQQLQRHAESLSIHTQNARSRQQKTSIVFLFPGRGAQYSDMARALYDEDFQFRASVNQCIDLVEQKFPSVLQHLEQSADKERRYQNAFALIGYDKCNSAAFQDVMLFAIEWSLAQWLISVAGIRPSAFCGHSMGEYAAACSAGLIPLEMALSLIVHRGVVIDQSESRSGSMLLVDCWLELEDLKERLAAEFPEVDIATVNSATCFTLAGSRQSIEELRVEMSKTEGAIARILANDGGIAFHSRQVETLLDELRSKFGEVVSSHAATEKDQKTSALCTSCVTGDAHETSESVLSAEYWCTQMREPVQYCRQIESIMKHISATSSDHSVQFVEVGPGAFLTRMASRIIGDCNISTSFVTTMRPARSTDVEDDVRAILQCVGRMWQERVDVDWNSVHMSLGNRPEHPIRVSLPTYPFDRRRCWIEPPSNDPISLNSMGMSTKLTLSLEQAEDNTTMNGHIEVPKSVAEIVQSQWCQVLGIDASTPDMHADFFEQGGDSLTASELAHRISREIGLKNQVTPQLIIDNSVLKDLIHAVELLDPRSDDSANRISSPRPKLKRAATSSVLKMKMSDSLSPDAHSPIDLTAEPFPQRKPKLEKSRSSKDLHIPSEPLVLQKADRHPILRAMPHIFDRRRSVSDSPQPLERFDRAGGQLVQLYHPFTMSLSKRKTNPVLVMVHPMSGDTTVFSRMAQQFRSLQFQARFYACRSPALGDSVPESVSVRSLATQYVAEMLERFGDDTVFLIGGYSFGGLVAVEMVRILDAMGLQTPLLVMCDVPGVKAMKHMEAMSRDKKDSAESMFMTAMTRAMPLYGGNSPKSPASSPRNGNTPPSPNGSIERLKRQAKESGTYYNKMLTAWKLHTAAMYSFARSGIRPFALDKVEVLYFSCTKSAAADLPVNLHVEWCQEERGVFRGPTRVKVYPIEENHWSMMQSPMDIVRRIRDWVLENI